MTTTFNQWLTLILITIGTSSLFGQTTIWSETFESYADNATTASNNNSDNSAVDWSISGSNPWGYFRVDNYLSISGNNSFVQYASYYGETVWTTESVDISSYSDVSVSMDYNEYGTLESYNDYMTIAYELDGSGTWITLGNGYHAGNMSGSETASTTGLNGSSVKLRVTLYTSWSDEYWYFDNVLIEGTAGGSNNCNPCYSVANGNINDENTWSDISGGTAGFNPPTDGTADLVIEGGYTVNMNTDFSVNDLTVGSSGDGVLLWTADNVQLDLENGGTVTVASGSRIDEGNRTNADLYFNDNGGNNTYTFTVNDATNGLEIDRIYLQEDANVTMAGSGIITVNENFDFTNADITYVNNMTGTISIGGELGFYDDCDRVSFTNNGTINTTGDWFIYKQSDDGVWTNNGTMNIGTNLMYDHEADYSNDHYIENNGTLNVTAQIFIGNDNCDITNNSIMTLNSLYYDGDSDRCDVITNAGATTTVTDYVFFEEEATEGSNSEWATNNQLYNAGTFNLTNSLSCNQISIDVNNAATGVITIGGDIIQNRTGMDMNNFGTMTVSELELSDNSDEINAVNSGTLNFTNVRAANGDLDITNTGTINQSGTFIDGQIDGDCYFTNSTNGQWNYEGTSHDNSTLLDCSATDNTFNYSNTGDQDMIDAVSNIYYHLEITESGTKTTADDLDINGNLTIANSAILDPSSNDITIAGNWTNTSSNGFTEGSDNVTFDGTNDQTITCSTIGTETFHNLLINKSNGSLVTLNNPVSLTNNGILNFNGSNGYLVLNGNDFTIPNWTSGDITGFDTNEFIVVDGTGFIKYTGVTNGEVIDAPMGLGTGTTNYSLAVLTMNDPGSNTFDANMCGQVQLDGGLCDGTALTTGVVGQTWNFISTSTNAEVKLYWDTSTESAFDRTTCSVIHYDGSSWEDFGFGNATSEGGSLYSRSATTTGFSPFSVQDNSIILPVSLLGFDTQNIDDQIEVTWTTISELNNAFFTIEKSIDGIHFETVATVQGQGNSNATNQYSIIDETPYQGISYYRLTQTDYNGSSESFQLVKVLVGSEIEAIIYPNPVIDNKLSIDILGDFEEATIQVYNELGVEIMHQLLEEENHFEIKFEYDLPAGYYFVLIHVNGTVIKKSIIIQ